MLSLTGGWLKFISEKQVERNQKNGFLTVFQPFFSPDFSSLPPKSGRNRTVFLSFKRGIGRHFTE